MTHSHAVELAEKAKAVVRALGSSQPHPFANDPGNVPRNKKTNRLSFTEDDLTIHSYGVWTTTAKGDFQEWHLTVTWGQEEKLKARYRESTPEDSPGQIQFLSCSDGPWETALAALADRATAAIKA